jgi:hypothetical protein
VPPTGELARIDDELRRAYDGDCWHGPPLRVVLAGVTAATAAARPSQLAHPVWALVNHLAAWVEVTARRIAEWRAIESPDAGDFPPVTDAGGAAWAATLDDLDRRHRRLLDVVAGLDEPKLDEIVPGKTYPAAVRAIFSRKSWSLIPPCPARALASSRALSAASM